MPTMTITRSGLQCPTKYHKDMEAVVPAKFTGMTYKGSTITLYFSEELTAGEVSAVEAADVAFVDIDQPLYVLNTILFPARSFGVSLIAEFTAENILLGITQAGLTNHVRKTSHEIVNALETGSLYDAMYEIRQVPAEDKDAVFLSDARLLCLVNCIETYLGITPLSTSL